MATLQKKFYVSTNLPNKDMGVSIPPWNTDPTNISSWYFDSSIDYYYNIVDNVDLYIQYGKNIKGWASARFLQQSLEIVNETQENDGSITADVQVQSLFFKGVKNEYAQAGWDVHYRVTINNVVQYDFNGNTFENFSQGAKPILEMTVNVPPQEENKQTAFKIEITYPNGEGTNNVLEMGFSLFNPNPISYVPMAIRKVGTWKDLNSNNGKIKIRKSGTWVDKSEENANTSRQVGQGKNRIRKNNQWRQLPKMTGGQAND